MFIGFNNLRVIIFGNNKMRKRGHKMLTENQEIKETCLTWWLERAMLLRLSIASDME
jgi:hypothetical protein